MLRRRQARLRLRKLGSLLGHHGESIVRCTVRLPACGLLVHPQRLQAGRCDEGMQPYEPVCILGVLAHAANGIFAFLTNREGTLHCLGRTPRLHLRLVRKLPAMPASHQTRNASSHHVLVSLPTDQYLQLLSAMAVLLRMSGEAMRSEEHTSELQSLMRISYAVFCLKKQNKTYMCNI